MAARDSTTVSDALDGFLASVRVARSRLSGLHGLVDAAADANELAATIAAARSIRDDLLATATAEARWLDDATDTDVLLDITDSVDDHYRLHADLSRRVAELRGLLQGLAGVTTQEAAGTPRRDPPEEWGSGDVFAEVYR